MKKIIQKRQNYILAEVNQEEYDKAVHNRTMVVDLLYGTQYYCFEGGVIIDHGKRKVFVDGIEIAIYDFDRDSDTNGNYRLFRRSMAPGDYVAILNYINLKGIPKFLERYRNSLIGFKKNLTEMMTMINDDKSLTEDAGQVPSHLLQLKSEIYNTLMEITTTLLNISVYLDDTAMETNG